MSDDLISRQAAIDAIKTWGLIDGLAEGQAIEILADEEKLPSAQQWIPCSEVSGEGYPKENGFYYVTEQNYGFYLDADTRQKVAHTSHFFNGDFTDRFYYENHSNIVAWMPLPKPYEAERKEE